MRSILPRLVLIAALVVPFGIPASVAGSAPPAGPDVTQATDTMTDIPVRGSTADGGTFRGRLDVVNFRLIENRIYAIGLLSGRLFDADGDLIGRVQDERVRMPVTFPSLASDRGAASCDILRLRLGPLDLDLLGLVVHLDRIRLDITAEPGPGNLLGNLLCAIAGLLDQTPRPLDVLVHLLRAILEILTRLS